MKTQLYKLKYLNKNMKKIIGLGETFGSKKMNDITIKYHRCKNHKCKVLTTETFNGYCINCISKLNGGKK